MPTRITRVSAHQNGKVTGVLMALVSIIFVVPLLVIVHLTLPAGTPAGGPPLGLIIAMPIGYRVIGYLSTVIGGWLYNGVARMTGCIEFELEDRT